MTHNPGTAIATWFPSRPGFASLGAVCVLSAVLVDASGLQAQQVTLAAQAQTNAAVFRDQIGRHLTFICPAHVNINQDIYGTDVYTDTSPICAAAAHAGVFTRGTSTAVTIRMGGEAPSFTASTRNSVTSLAYGRWSGTYVFVRGGPPGRIDWGTTIVSVAPDYLTPITLECPPASAERGEIWGSDVYPEDSAICVAGVHAGAITMAGGMLTLTRVPKQAGFPATTRYEITSRLWSDPAWRSYPQPYSVAAATVPAAAPAPTVNGVLVQPTATTGTAMPMTQPTPTATTASVGVTAGPIVGTNPVATSNKDLFGPPAPRSILLSPFTAAGGLQAPSARTIRLPALTAAGGIGMGPSRKISLPQFNASGEAPSSTIALIAPRAVQLPAYSAIGATFAVATRRIALPVFTATSAPGVPPRIIKLPAFTAVGVP